MTKPLHYLATPYFALLGKPILYLDCETLAFASETGE